MESFPADIPCAVLRKAGVQYFFTTIPAGTHHSDSGEQRPIAWQVKTQTVGCLEVVAVLEVGVLLRVDKQGIESGLRVANTGGSHRHHTVVPTPCGLEVPIFHSPVHGMVDSDTIAVYRTGRQ